MQKKLIAVAVAALAAGSAFAQSNVTIYGRINSYVEHIGNSSPTSGVPAADTLKRTRVTNNSSNIGFRGEEDLGNGLKAWFQVESDVSVSDGGGAFSGRNSGVGLKGSWGNVMMGTWDAYYADHLRATGMGLAYGFSASDLAVLNSTGAASGTVSFGPTRARNQVRYSLPNISGFTGYIAYSAGNHNLLNATAEGKSATAGATTYGADEKTWVINGSYNNGPIFASLSYFQLEDVGAVRNDTKRTGWKGAASYDFSFGTHLGLTYEQLKGRDSVGSARKNAWVLNVAQKFGAHNIGLYYGVAGDVKGTAPVATTYASGVLATGGAGFGTPGSTTGAKWIALQYDYSFSKRTVGYAGYAKLSNEAAASYEFFGGLNGTAGTGATAGSNPTAFWLGMSHAF